MDEFEFIYSGVEDRYQENSRRVRFGNGYQFASRPNGPPQIQFRLMMKGMAWFTQADGITLAVNPNPERNLNKLRAFYEKHELWNPFIFPHVYRGDITVRFMEPLIIPALRINSNGVAPDFDVNLISMP